VEVSLSDVRERVTPWHLQPPTVEDVEGAVRRISGVLVRTPLLESERVNRRLGCRLFVKAEGLQRTGSFKARGAWNTMSLLFAEGRLDGVICGSSGNHGQAVAWAANRFGVPALVMMPHDAPATKVERTSEWGAEIVRYDRHRENRDIIGHRLAAQRSLTSISAFDDRRIIAGAATLSVEITDQARELGTAVDRLVVNCSGGGMAAGCALMMRRLGTATEVWATEPENYDDLDRSLAAGTLLRNDGVRPSSICDSLMAPSTGPLTFSIMREYLSGAVKVSDQEVLTAMRLAYSEFGLVVEPGGAAGLAAVLSGRIDVKDRNVTVVLSGSNVDASIFRNAIDA
jgi:threonine dehydratase